MWNWGHRLKKRVFESESDSGVTTVEYAVMLVLIALVVAAFGAGINGSITGVFSRMIAVLISSS